MKLWHKIAVGALVYTAVASWYNSGKTSGTLPNPIGNLIGFA